MPTWTWKPFNELTPNELYDFLQLRELVFTIGQNCSEEDIDGVDKKATHLMGHENNTLVAYLRIYEKENKIFIGRVVTHPEHQKKGIGRQMMNEALAYCQRTYPTTRIEMSAQLYLKEFYESLGFKTDNKIYLEADIEHIKMWIDQ